MVRFPCVLQLSAALAAALAFTSPASAQASPQTPAAAPVPIYTPTSLTPTSNLPKTPDGRPDFQNIVWASNFFPVFEANPIAATLVVSEADGKKMVDMMVAGMSKQPFFEIDPEAHEIIGNTDGLPLVRGERRSRTLVLPADGKLPLTPDARKEVDTTDALDGPLDNPEQRPTGERCIVLGAPPISATISYTRLRFIQTPSHVVVHTENGDDARIIPFTDTHKPAGGPRSWLGDSIARWEGDTLVIETIRLPKELRVRGLPSIIVSDEATVIERITRLSEDELLYQYTVVDPKVYTAPWLAEYSLYSSKTGMFPSPCHEHNYSLPNILQGARVIEARAIEARTAKAKPKAR